jgi:hypothetical protein
MYLFFHLFRSAILIALFNTHKNSTSDFKDSLEFTDVVTGPFHGHIPR